MTVTSAVTVTSTDIDVELEQWLDRQEPKETAAARRERDKRLEEAWRKPYLPSALAVLIRSNDPIKDVAAALHRQCEPQRRGKPGGRHLRWQRPHYLVAWLVERGPTLPPDGTDELITHRIIDINGWAFMRGKRPLDPNAGGNDHERVKALLRGSKRRRL